MFRVISFSVVAIAATLLLLTANAEELRPSKLRPYELGPDGSLMVAGSPGLSVQSPARDLFELSRRTTGVSGAPASIDGNSELWEEASKSLARTSPKEFLIPLRRFTGEYRQDGECSEIARRRRQSRAITEIDKR